MIRMIIPVRFFAYYYAWRILSLSFCDAFNSCIGCINPTLLSWSSSSWSGMKTMQKEWRRTLSPRTIIAHAAAGDDGCADGEKHIETTTAYYETKLSSDCSRVGGKKQRKVYSRLASWLRRSRTTSAQDDTNVTLEQQEQSSTPTYRFTYDYNERIIDAASKRAGSQQTKTTGIILIHPIGVGIGKWFYDRLFTFLSKERCNNNDRFMMEDRRLVVLAPDLLGSATACCPTDIASGTAITNKLPLLNITDWSGQILHLMSEYETKCCLEERGYTIDNWCIVANGGCSPIALHVAASSYSTILNQTGIIPSSLRAPVTHVILSSPPRLSFFLPISTASAAIDPNKVQKSYRILSGIVGQLFWWYALRNNGTFIQKFSERNLVGNPTNLGKEWTPNCIATARLHNEQSRYSTFAFLAGSLQDGCLESLRILLKGHNSTSPIKIDFIRGTDRRRNRARSWFWTRRGKRKEKSAHTKKSGGKRNSSDVASSAGEMTIQQYVSNNGNRGKEVFVDGARISLAWENADEYAKRLLELCAD